MFFFIIKKYLSYQLLRAFCSSNGECDLNIKGVFIQFSTAKGKNQQLIPKLSLERVSSENHYCCVIVRQYMYTMQNITLPSLSALSLVKIVNK